MAEPGTGHRDQHEETGIEAGFQTRFGFQTRVDLQICVPGRQPVSLAGPRAEAFSLVMLEQTGSTNQILHILTDPIVPDPLVVLVHMALHGYFFIKALFE